MTNQERAQKIYAHGVSSTKIFTLEWITSQLDAAVAEAIEKAFGEKYKAQGFAAAREKAAGILGNEDAGMHWVRRIRAMEPDK